jgi:hypothetical protein
MANHTGKRCFRKGQSGNPGVRPKLPAEMREMFQAKAPEAFEVLCKGKKGYLMPADLITPNLLNALTQGCSVRMDLMHSAIAAEEAA